MVTSNHSNNNEFITNIFGDRYLSSVNGNKFEEIAYSTYFDIEILPQLSSEFTFYIFIGTDSGMLLNHLMQLNIDPASIYLFIEAEEIIAKISNDILVNKPPNILTSNIENWQKQTKDSYIIKYIEVGRVQEIKSFSAKDNIFAPYSDYAKTLHDDINQLKWLHPDRFQKKIYIQRQIENCADNIRPAIELKDILKGKPALILAGGPSLDDYIDWIEQHQQYYVVIAVSRIARRLLSTKIVPDIFVTADPFESAYKTSKEVLTFSEQSILVHQAYAHSKLIRQWEGPKFYLGELLPWECDYQPENIKAIGPTVTNGAIHLAIQMGIIDQILFGVDLCYSPDGYTHVSETIEHDMGVNLGFSGAPVTTNNGKHANTTYEMLEARVSISLLAELTQKQGGGIISTSPNSAKIKHVSYLSLSDIKVPTIKVQHYIEKLLLKITQEKNDSQHLAILLKENKKIKEQASHILSYTTNIVNICSLQYKTKENIINIDTKKQITEIENKLNKYCRIVPIIESFGINGYYDFIKPEKIITTDNNLDAFEYYYTSLYIASDSFIEFITENIKNIKYHTYTKSEANNTKSFKQGKKQNKTKKFRLNNLEKNLYHLFKTKNKDQLEYIIQQISPFNTEESISLICLAKGYLHEINNNIDQAINEYLNANSKNTLESGLKRILDITLKEGDLENTILVLKSLSEISKDYLIQLANLYQLSEQYKDALEIYSLYIEQEPNDILILLKMGKLYLSLDIFDGAKFIFEHIMKIDPYNKTAAQNLKNITKKIYPTKTVRIKYLPTCTGIAEYLFYKQLKNNMLDIQRLKKSEKTKTIGFIASYSNMADKIFTNYIKTLSQKFENIRFTIFYFDEKLKDISMSIFSNMKSRIKYIKPKSIYNLVEEVELYIIYPIRSNNSAYNQYIMHKEIENILTKYCRNIYFFYYRSKLYDITLDETSTKWKGNINYLITRYNNLGINTQELESENANLARIVFTDALNYKVKNKASLSYQGDKQYYIKTIEWLINNKNMIHFFHDYRKA